MPRKYIPKGKAPVTLIPKYRDQIDVTKLCQALILTAREKESAPSKKRRSKEK